MNYEQVLSANTLFHFTKNVDNLESILRNEFYPRYCLEDWSVVFPEVPEIQEIAIPMVSFCDIPLSQIKNHVKHYGPYALGLTKDWGIKKGICPVLYTHRKAKSAAHFKEIIINTLGGMRKHSKPEFKIISDDWSQFMQFLKLYKGRLWRDGKYLKNKITFYDEREWRFCPNILISNKPINNRPKKFLRKELFIQPDVIKRENIILEEYKLSFAPKDIKYIIVERKDEILEMLNKVAEIKQSKYLPDDLKVLTTRIISMEQIAEDF
jgi:hypothetical protein